MSPDFRSSGVFASCNNKYFGSEKNEIHNTKKYLKYIHTHIVYTPQSPNKRMQRIMNTLLFYNSESCETLF